MLRLNVSGSLVERRRRTRQNGTRIERVRQVDGCDPEVRRRRNPGYLCVSVAVALTVRGDRAHRHHVRAVTGMLCQEDLIRRVGDTVLDGDLSADDGIV